MISNFFSVCAELVSQCVSCLPHFCARLCTCVCVFVGWDVGGLENVRNVEESNQNVPL